ncbi:MAG TPA: tRNA epoxyqueuosine(34) reductase QueG, partial [Bacillota bacterium]|nr:tRNA epoxyqueuosine(34) reductase QueG [Bacillota bacterium]
GTGLTGRVGSFALGRDYHVVLREKIVRLMAAWQERMGQQVCWQAQVDTGPLADRAAAWRAGLGWYGKNCSIISPDYGSAILLGTILTDVELEPDQPLPPQCGDCTLCLEACPTGALEGPNRLNAYQCISYLTQCGEPMPENLRHKLGDNIYGCDICLSVCPHNRKAAKMGNGANRVQLDKLLTMSNREFSSTMGQTAAGWKGKKLLQRNALIALGNSEQAEAVPLLLQALADPRPEIRGSAAWALARFPGPVSGQALEQRLAREADERVREEINQALVFIKETQQRQKNLPGSPT